MIGTTIGIVATISDKVSMKNPKTMDISTITKDTMRYLHSAIRHGVLGGSLVAMSEPMRPNTGSIAPLKWGLERAAARSIAQYRGSLSDHVRGAVHIDNHQGDRG